MPITHPTDSNGITYNAIGTAAWYGQEGVELRAAGWAYCGYGTWGIYIRPPGTTQDDCYKKTSSPTQPNIAPQAPPDESVPVAAVKTVKDSCSTCRKPAAVAPAPSGPPSPTAPGAPAPKSTQKSFPWWLVIVLVLVAVSHGRDD